jgi:hypothetical protein
LRFVAPTSAYAGFLTARGTGYQASVDAFQPYDRLQSPNEPARAGLRKLLAGSLQKRRRCYVYINNRLEGCAPRTIEAALAAIAKELAENRGIEASFPVPPLL